jgi:hypothetical protein
LEWRIIGFRPRNCRLDYEPDPFRAHSVICSVYLFRANWRNPTDQDCRFLQMVFGTRNTPEGFGDPSASGSRQQNPPPPPPPPSPSMAQILVTQNELLRQLIHGQQQGERHNHQPQL